MKDERRCRGSREERWGGEGRERKEKMGGSKSERGSREIMEERERREGDKEEGGALMNNPSANIKGNTALEYHSDGAKHVGGVVQRAV